MAARRQILSAEQALARILDSQATEWDYDDEETSPSTADGNSSCMVEDDGNSSCMVDDDDNDGPTFELPDNKEPGVPLNYDGTNIVQRSSQQPGLDFNESRTSECDDSMSDDNDPTFELPEEASETETSSSECEDMEPQHDEIEVIQDSSQLIRDPHDSAPRDDPPAPHYPIETNMTESQVESYQVIVQSATADTTIEELPLPPPPPPPISNDLDLDLPLPPPPPPEMLDNSYIDLPFPPPPPPSMLMFPDNEMTPSRKRIRKVDSWKRNVKSARYNNGVSKKSGGEEVMRSLKPPCATECRRQCRSKLPEEVRMSIFKAFWGMASKKGRRDFIVAHVHSHSKSRTRGKCASKNRAQTLKYTLPDENASCLQVCKSMFLNTLDVSDSMVLYNLKNAVHNVVQVRPHPPAHNAISEVMLQGVREHIESFPKVESHYCRADSKRLYLEASLNIREMYRLYKSAQVSNGQNFVSEYKYRQIFNEEFNFSFHVPSKDVCDTCSKFDLKSSPTPEENKNQEAHLRRKLQAREHKEIDKNNPEVVSAAFDLQQVITCPKLAVSSSYYLRKLNIYNFTIFNLRTREGTCYAWNESECNRGTNDIATCVWMWLKERESEGVKHVIFYSDCCGGQNRNRLMTTALSKFLSNSKSILKIEQKFFETGHSKNECDSMHSVIQNKYKNCNVFLPSGFYDHMKHAQHKQPYIVNVLTHKDVLDFSLLNEQYMSKTAFNGIQKIHHIIYKKLDDGVSISFSLEIGGEASERLFLKRGKNHRAFQRAELATAYSHRCGIDEQKKADLAKLTEFLPEDCKAFYESL